MAGLAHRRLTAERMDDPAVDAGQLNHALRSLARLNLLSGSVRNVWRPIRRLALVRAASDGPLRVLDVATGAGDVPIELWRKATGAGVRLAVEGCDVHPVAVAHARAAAGRLGVPIRFFEHDIAAGPPLETYDVVMASLFLHHLPDEQGVAALRNMARATSRLLLIVDLRRTLAGLALAYLGSRFATTSDIVRYDALASVRSAFTPMEALALAGRAGLDGARVRRVWPERYVLEWEPHESR